MKKIQANLSTFSGRGRRARVGDVVGVPLTVRDFKNGQWGQFPPVAYHGWEDGNRPVPPGVYKCLSVGSPHCSEVWALLAPECDHPYTEKTCACGHTFCYQCCAGTNVDQGGKYDPDYMICPVCGADYYEDNN